MAEELSPCIFQPKSTKGPGEHNISIEFPKSVSPLLNDNIIKLFNDVPDRGYFPHS